MHTARIDLLFTETPEINLSVQHARGGGLIWTVRKLEAIVGFSLVVRFFHVFFILQLLHLFLFVQGSAILL